MSHLTYILTINIELATWTAPSRVDIAQLAEFCIVIVVMGSTTHCNIATSKVLTKMRWSLIRAEAGVCRINCFSFYDHFRSVYGTQKLPSA